MASCGADNGLSATKVSTVMSVEENSSERFVSSLSSLSLSVPLSLNHNLHLYSSDGQDDENGVFSLPSLHRERERKHSIIYTKKRTIYTAGV